MRIKEFFKRLRGRQLEIRFGYKLTKESKAMLEKVSEDIMIRSNKTGLYEQMENADVKDYEDLDIRDIEKFIEDLKTKPEKDEN